MKRILLSVLAVAMCVLVLYAAQKQTKTKIPMSPQDPNVSKTELTNKLTPLQYKVTQMCGTEPPFQNAYWDNKKPGIYVDIVSGEPLFSSLDKFDSGTGWPSFTKAIDDAEIVEKKDATHGMVRTEVRSGKADSHLGHLFDDGPGPSGNRYCINSASLRFIPVEKLQEEGYGKYLASFVKAGVIKESAGAAPASEKATSAARTEKATLAGGCFWGMEEIIRQIPGVISTTVGYIGGKTKNPTYKDICTGTTGHAEAVEITYDPTKTSYDILLTFFFRMHDPTTLNRQHNDVGTQYRSAIFYHSDEQKKVAEEVKARIDKSGKWKKPIVTEIVKATEFYPGEDYHQDYLQKNPGGYNCHFLRD
jgi:peptide methionine sulfoxide reductase msrA/msrB